jgi:hypothetical protein
MTLAAFIHPAAILGLHLLRSLPGDPTGFDSCARYSFLILFSMSSDREIALEVDVCLSRATTGSSAGATCVLWESSFLCNLAKVEVLLGSRLSSQYTSKRVLIEVFLAVSTPQLLRPPVLQVRCVVFDKTGTLTVGRPTVTASKVFAPHRLEDVLALAAAAEAHSEHPLGTAILDYARHVSQSHPNVSASSSSDVTDTSWLQRADEFEAVPGGKASERRWRGRRSWWATAG